MTREEERLLLYLECRCVDNGGWIDPKQMNDTDFEICRRWHKSNYIIFGRMLFHLIEPNKTHLVRLSLDAWKDAARLRRERALRNYPKDLDRSMLCGEQGSGPLEFA